MSCFVNINCSKNISNIFFKNNYEMFQNTWNISSDRLISRITIESSNCWNKCLQPYINLSSSKVTDCVPKLYCRVSVSRCVCASHSSDVQVFYTSFAWLLQLKSLIFWLQVLQTANFTSNCHFKVTLWIKNKNFFMQLNYIFIQY